MSAAAGTTEEAGLTASAASAVTAQGGSVTVNADGSFSYTPASGFAGTDTFGYTVTDASGDTAAGTAAVVVAASNSSPKADVAVGLSCSSSLSVGQTGLCTLTVTNHGPAAATKLTAVVTLPAVVSEVSCGGCARPRHRADLVGAVAGVWRQRQLPGHRQGPARPGQRARARRRGRAQPRPAPAQQRRPGDHHRQALTTKAWALT